MLFTEKQNDASLQTLFPLGWPLEASSITSNFVKRMQYASRAWTKLSLLKISGTLVRFSMMLIIIEYLNLITSFLSSLRSDIHMHIYMHILLHTHIWVCLCVCGCVYVGVCFSICVHVYVLWVGQVLQCIQMLNSVSQDLVALTWVNSQVYHLLLFKHIPQCKCIGIIKMAISNHWG